FEPRARRGSSTPVVTDEVAGDRVEQPPDRRNPGGLLLKQADERLLDDVLRRRGIPDQGEGIEIDGAAVPSIELPHRGEISAAIAVEQAFVGLSTLDLFRELG